MNAVLRKLWASRAPRERMVIAALAAVLGAAAYLWVLH
jgi:type II secretory pathway component PulM